MRTGRLSQAGAPGQPPTQTSRSTRAGSKAAANTNTDRKSLSLGLKKGKPLTAGEHVRQVLTDRGYIVGEEQATPYALYTMFQNFVDKHNTAISEDLHAMLQAFTTLMQESASSKQITRKSINAVTQSVVVILCATTKQSKGEVNCQDVVTDTVFYCL